MRRIRYSLCKIVGTLATPLSRSFLSSSSLPTRTFCVPLSLQKPEDALAQAMYLQSLLKDPKPSPSTVIHRVESRRYNNNHPITVASFLEALGTSREIWRYVNKTPAELERLGVLHANLDALLSDLATLSTPSTDAGSVPLSAAKGSPLNPVQVYVQGQPPTRLGMMGSVGRIISTMVNVGFIAVAALLLLAVLDRNTGQKNGTNQGLSASAGLSDPSVGLGAAAFAPKQYNKDILPEKDIKTFADVKGCPEAKNELMEVVQFLKEPSRFTRLGAKLPKGVMLYGPPGTGKTLLAKAVAGEAGVPFFYRSGSEFEEMYVGVGARRVRSLFQAAQKAAPCIVFIDEIDAIGGSRKSLENHAARKTLNQLLVEMDGFESTEGVIVMAATNIPDALDPALTRPGRFDRHVHIALPDVSGRTEILEHYLAGKPVTPELDARRYARATSGFSGADLSNLINESALLAAKLNKPRIETWMLDEARDKISMGSARTSAIVPESERRNTAFHEAGHALVALLTRGAMPIRKATIVPRGRALGMVQQVPDDDYSSLTVEQMHARLDVCMGGRVAEHLVFGWDKVSAGASNDLVQASRLARAMVTEYGLSPVIGPVSIGKDDGSEEMKRKVDEEVSRLLREAHTRVEKLLLEHRTGLDRIAEALLSHENLTGDEVKEAMNGKLMPWPEKLGLHPELAQTVTRDAAGIAPTTTTATPSTATVPSTSGVEVLVTEPAPVTVKRLGGAGNPDRETGTSTSTAEATPLDLLELLKNASGIRISIQTMRTSAPAASPTKEASPTAEKKEGGKEEGKEKKEKQNKKEGR
jgi:ATP-dependent metalloprotease